MAKMVAKVQSGCLFIKRGTSSFYRNAVLEQYLKHKPDNLKIKDLLQFGQHMSERKLVRSANFIREELPKRLAHRIQAFQSLPFVVGTNPHINEVYNLYWDAFDSFRKVPEIKTLQDNEEYCRILRHQLQAHLVVIPSLARGLQESAEHFPSKDELETFLMQTLRSRISRRLLAQQHIRLSDSKPTEAGYVGVLSPSLEAIKLAQHAVDLAQDICKRTYGVAPQVIIDGNRDATLAGVPEHIQYVMYELLKNSMRAVVEKGGYAMLTDDHFEHDAQVVPEKSLPPITISIAQSTKDLVYRISDQGGGISSDKIDKIWNYGYTTAKRLDVQDVMPKMAATLSEHHVTPMAGMGFGLTIARVYAMYLGGSIQMRSMDGFGTDSYYRLLRLAEDQQESIV